MLGMGTTAAGSSQSGNLLTELLPPLPIKGYEWATLLTATVGGRSHEGDVQFGNWIGANTQQTTSAIGTATNAIGSWVSGYLIAPKPKMLKQKQ